MIEVYDLLWKISIFIFYEKILIISSHGMLLINRGTLILFMLRYFFNYNPGIVFGLRKTPVNYESYGLGNQLLFLMGKDCRTIHSHSLSSKELMYKNTTWYLEYWAASFLLMPLLSALTASSTFFLVYFRLCPAPDVSL